MSRLTIRPYEERDEEGFYSVLSLTYNNGLEVPVERRQNRYGANYVAESDGQIHGIFSTMEMCVTRGAATLPCAGVAGVGVAPDQRRAGVGISMMRWSVGHFRESGRVLAALYAFREPFYAKSGYVVCGRRIRLTVPVHRLPQIDCSLNVRRLTPADWKSLAVCHTQFAHSRSGVNVRSERNWERVLAEIKPLTIYAAGDPVQGYVAVSHKVAFWEEQWLSEVAWSTREGYLACLSVIRQIGINKSSVAWYEPSDSPYYGNFLDQGVTAQLDRPVMFRVCDVVKALESLTAVTSGRFTIGVQDPEVPENEGPFDVSFGPGGVEVRRTEQERPDIVFSIGQFTQAFMGEPGLPDLVRFGSVQVNSEAALESAMLLLPQLPVYCSDFF